MIIDIKKNDIIKYVYFISSFSNKKMYGGLAGKSDLIGGIFDRWINIISEMTIFDKYFLKKISDKFICVSDFYIYKPSKVNIAPDLIGVKTPDKVIPFVTFGNEGWHKFKNAPQIEVKTFKEDQYMVSLRDQGYSEKYLVLLEMNLNPDYLVSFIDESVLSLEVFSEIQMNNAVFIDEDFSGEIEQPKEIQINDNIGYLKLIRVTIAKDFMKQSTFCGPRISPHYLKTIRKTRNPKSNYLDIPLKNLCFCKDGLQVFNDKWYDILPLKQVKTLSCIIKNIDSITLVKTSKSSITLKTGNSKAFINNFILQKNTTYIIETGYLDRSGNKGEEYFIHKSIVSHIKDYENEMVKNIDLHIRENL